MPLGVFVSLNKLRMCLLSNRTVYLLNYTRKKNSSLPSELLVNLRNRTGEEIKRQTLCDKRDNNFSWKNIPPNFSFLLTDLFVKDQKTLMSITTKHASNNPVTFVTHKRFAVLFFLPSWWSKLTLIHYKNHLTGTGKLFRLISNNMNSKPILQSSVNNDASYIISSTWKISSKIYWYLFTSAVPRLGRGGACYRRL